MNRSLLITAFSIMAALLHSSCEELFDPQQDVFIAKEDYFIDWGEYRSAEMGLYSIQQKLVEQLVILGELRGDLLEITENVDKDLDEIYNFRISRENKYASPLHFYELIGACNSLLVQLERAHPEVLDPEVSETNYDRLYGEVLCMRAWAYFYAVRIYGKVPYIWQSLTTPDEIEEYVNSSGTYTDSVSIIFDPGGYYNDTVYNQTVTLDKKFLDMSAVIDTFTWQLENKIKVVGVIHNIDNGDLTWDVTVWNSDAMHYLLGQLFLFQGDYTRAIDHLEGAFLYNRESETTQIKFGLDGRFSNSSWVNIFTGIDTYEHILTLWFGIGNYQQNELQKLFSVVPPNKYMLRPTRVAMDYWETMWRDGEYVKNYEFPHLSRTVSPGTPGDVYRGQGISYAYILNNEPIKNKELDQLLELRRRGFMEDYHAKLMEYTPVVYKYTINKNSSDQDANYIIYRAAGAHLYIAEIYNRWEMDKGGHLGFSRSMSLGIVNDGRYSGAELDQLGVRGRIGFGGANEAIQGGLNIIWKYDPYTNMLTDWHDYSNNLFAKQLYLEDEILTERAREMAFEGERFYDLMRIAMRRNDPSYLADKVAAKFSGAKAEEIRSILLDESNWYVHYFE